MTSLAMTRLGPVRSGPVARSGSGRRFGPDVQAGPRRSPPPPPLSNPQGRSVCLYMSLSIFLSVWCRRSGGRGCSRPLGPRAGRSSRRGRGRCGGQVQAAGGLEVARRGSWARAVPSLRPTAPCFTAGMLWWWRWGDKNTTSLCAGALRGTRLRRGRGRAPPPARRSCSAGVALLPPRHRVYLCHACPRPPAAACRHSLSCTSGAAWACRGHSNRGGGGGDSGRWPPPPMAHHLAAAPLRRPPPLPSAAKRRAWGVAP